MSSFELVKIIGSASQQYFKYLGNRYKQKKSDFEEIKLKQMMMQSTPKKQSNWIDFLVLPLIRPFYQLLFMSVKVLVLNAPFWLGGYQGIDMIDVCSSLTGISTKHLVFLGEMCDERISQEIHGYTVVIITILVVLVVFYSLPIIKYLYEKRCEQLLLQREHETSIVNLQREHETSIENLHINTVQNAMNTRKRRESYCRGMWTKDRHKNAISTLETIEIVINTKDKDVNKMKIIKGAMDKFSQWWSPLPIESGSVPLLE